MPYYTYKCSKCHKVFDAYSAIGDRDKPKVCECNYTAPRDIKSEFAGKTSVDCTMKENERWSWSMGVHTDQIPAMEKMYPGSRYHPLTGQLQIRNREHKKQEMKRRGLIEYN